MVAVPLPLNVTLPLLTVATSSLLDVQLTFLLLALSGLTSAVRGLLSPTLPERLPGETLTPVTAIFSGSDGLVGSSVGSVFDSVPGVVLVSPLSPVVSLGWTVSNITQGFWDFTP